MLGGSKRDLMFLSVEDTCEADAGETGLLRTKHNWLTPKRAFSVEFKRGFGDELERAMSCLLQRYLSLCSMMLPLCHSWMGLHPADSLFLHPHMCMPIHVYTQVHNMRAPLTHTHTLEGHRGRALSRWNQRG